MSKAVLEILDPSLQKTEIWLNDFMGELGLDKNPQKAWLALRTALHALRDRLTVEETVHLGAQLPIFIRGVYYEGWKVTGTAEGAPQERIPGPRRRCVP